MNRFFLPVAIFACAFCMIVGIGTLVGVVGLQTQEKQELQSQLGEADKAIGRLVSDIAFLEEAYVAAVDARDAAVNDLADYRVIVAEDRDVRRVAAAAGILYGDVPTDAQIPAIVEAVEAATPVSQAAKETPATTIPASLVTRGASF